MGTSPTLRLGQPLHPYSSSELGGSPFSLGLLDPPDGLGNLKVIVGRQDLDGRLQLGMFQDLSWDLIGQSGGGST